MTDEFIEALVRCTADELPLPDCAITLTFIELLGGKLKESTAPIGFLKGGALWCSGQDQQ